MWKFVQCTQFAQMGLCKRTKQFSTFMAQNRQTRYFCNQEELEALLFQFELTGTTFKIWPYVALSQIFKRRAQLCFKS